MKLKRFDDMLNEAKKAADPAKKAKNEEVLNYLLGELKKKMMTRYEMIKTMEDKFKDDFKKVDLEKLTRKICDDICWEGGRKKYDIEIEKDLDKYPLYYIGDDAEYDESPKKKEEKSKEKKEDKEEKGEKRSSETYADKEGIKFGSAEWFAKYKRVRPEPKKNTDSRYKKDPSDKPKKETKAKKPRKPRAPRKPKEEKKLERFDSFKNL